MRQDKLNNGNPLFKTFKGFFNDDEDGAVERLRELFGLVNTNTNSVWWNKINLDGLTSNHRELFVNQLRFLLKTTTTSKKMFKFLIPPLKPGEGKKEININSDF